MSDINDYMFKMIFKKSSHNGSKFCEQALKLYKLKQIGT